MRRGFARGTCRSSRDGRGPARRDPGGWRFEGLDEGLEKKRELAEDCGPAARPGPEVALRAAPGPGP